MTDYPRALVPVDHVEPVPRRIRATLGGRVVLDTTRALYVWEWPPYPQYYIPLDDIDTDLLVDEGAEEQLPRGTARLHGLRVGQLSRSAAGWLYTSSPIEGLAGTVRFDWRALDSWFEEDEEVFVHPRDPYHRVDILESSRHVRVSVNGEVVAETDRPRILFETGLPPRYYITPEDVREDVLIKSEKNTQCPYKGVASYYSVEAGGRHVEDLVWYYPEPISEAAKIKGHLSFFNEKVDLEVDSEGLERPQTQWS